MWVLARGLRKRGGMRGTDGVLMRAPSRYSGARAAKGMAWLSMMTVGVTPPARLGASTPRLMRCITHISWPGGSSG